MLSGKAIKSTRAGSYHDPSKPKRKKSTLRARSGHLIASSLGHTLPDRRTGLSSAPTYYLSTSFLQPNLSNTLSAGRHVRAWLQVERPWLDLLFWLHADVLLIGVERATALMAVQLGRRTVHSQRDVRGQANRRVWFCAFWGGGVAVL